MFNNNFFDKERPIKVVPVIIIIALLIGVLVQIAWHWWRPSNAMIKVKELPVPPPKIVFQLASFGEPVALSKFLMLRLQAFDYQPGISIPFKDLAYDHVVDWLELILALDDKSHYPLLSASRLYAEVPDENKKRQMLRFIFAKFLEKPNARWQWMAHAVHIAKHKLKDMNLALSYAKALRIHTTAGQVPQWARQMEIFVLEDLGDIEGAKILLGGMLESGAVKDPNEIKFLKNRLGILD